MAFWTMLIVAIVFSLVIGAVFYNASRNHRRIDAVNKERRRGYARQGLGPHPGGTAPGTVRRMRGRTRLVETLDHRGDCGSWPE